MLDKHGMGEDLKGAGWYAVPGGLAMMVNALNANMQRNAAGRMQQQANNGFSASYTNGLPNPPGAAPMVPPAIPPQAGTPPVVPKQAKADEDDPVVPDTDETYKVKPRSEVAPSEPNAALPGGAMKLASLEGATLPGMPPAQTGPTSAPIQLAASAKPAAVGGTSTVPGAVGAPINPANGIPPNLMPQASTYSKQDLFNMIRNPYADPAMRNMAIQMYLGTQVNPRSVPYMGGNFVISPDGKQQYYAPNVEWKNEKSSTGAERSTPQFVTPGGVNIPPPTLQRIEEPPTPAAPTPGPRGDIPGSNKVAEAASDLPPVGIPNLPEPPKVPETGNQILDAAQGKGGPLEAPAPKLAESFDQWDARQRDIKTQQVGNEEAAKKSAESFQKKYDTIQDLGSKASNEIPNIQQALKLVDDPHFASGFGADPTLLMQQIGGFLGIDKTAQTPNEMFSKLTAGLNLEALKQYLQGLGQVRVAEMNLVNQASASKAIGPVANKIILESALRMHQKAADLATMAQDYATQHGRLDYGFDKASTKYNVEHPIFTQDEIKNYQQRLEEEAKTLGGGEKKAAPKSPTDLSDDDLRRILQLSPK